MKKPLFLALSLGAGCASPAPQVVSGHVDQASFATPVDHVLVVRGNSLIAAAAVGPQGEFTLSIPPGSGYRLELRSMSAKTGLISPRATGTIDVAFAIRGAQVPFELGAVRAIGAPGAHTYSAHGDTELECEDGLDPDGAVCVDDDEEATSCDEQDGENNDGETADDGEQSDGDGETADDGEESDGDGETDDDNALPDSAAVADHNLPSSLGCGEHENEGDEEGEH